MREAFRARIIGIALLPIKLDDQILLVLLFMLLNLVIFVNEGEANTPKQLDMYKINNAVIPSTSRLSMLSTDSYILSKSMSRRNGSTISSADWQQRSEVRPTESKGNMSSYEIGLAPYPRHLRRSRRSVIHLYNMVVCATGCNPLSYKGYGCYCGFLGSGVTVDGIDKCCQIHDWCYDKVRCKWPVTYLIPYEWQCNEEQPKCGRGGTFFGQRSVCAEELCECDRQFTECLKKFPCPKTKAMCVTSPWRYWQNIFMRLGTGPSSLLPPIMSSQFSFRG